MELIANIGIGFATALTPANLLYCLAGVFLGTLIGVLPGLGPTATIAMLLPLTFTLPPVSALIMLAGIYYGSQYGGSTTSILVNVPGEAASVVTTLDGYQMAQQGRAGVALTTAAVGSFFAGTVATLLIALFASPMAAIALKFGPAEFFSLIVLGLLAAIVLSRGSLLHAVGMVVRASPPGAEQGAAAGQHAAQRGHVEGHVALFAYAVPRVEEPDQFVAVDRLTLAHDRADHSVEPGAVTTTCQNANTHVRRS